MNQIILSLSVLFLLSTSSLSAKKHCEQAIEVLRVKHIPGVWKYKNMSGLVDDPSYIPRVDEANDFAFKLRDLLIASLNEQSRNWKVGGCWVVIITPSVDYEEVVVRLVKASDYRGKRDKAKEKRTTSNRLDIDDDFFNIDTTSIAHEVYRRAGKPVW